MQQPSLRRAPARWLLPVLVLFAELAGAGHALAQARQKQVLVLYSARRDSQISIVGERELPRILDEGLDVGLDYYSEHIDNARFPDPKYQAGFRDFLQLKYQGQRFDLVIAINDLALEFLDQYRDVLFPNVPVVFFASSPVDRHLPDSTGVIAHLNLTDTLVLAADLQPDVRQVFVVVGVDRADGSFEVAARTQFRPFEARFSITYLVGLATKELERRLSSLPPNSIIYYVIVNRDATGENFHPLEYLDRLAMNANAPIYSWVDSTMNHHVVGGSLKSQTAETDALGQLAVRVLNGERADSIPVTSPELNVRQVDWRELQKWHISEARVPPGVEMRFRNLSLWDRYRLFILGAIGLLVAQTALITGLLLQRSRRRQAEENVLHSQAELRATYERIRDLGARLLNAQEAERSHIARELHDDISQQMALLEIDLELLSQRVGGDAEALADEALDRAHIVSKSVHDLSHRLHPAKLRLVGLVAALHGLRHEMSQPGTTITFTHENIPTALPLELTFCLFRVAQEGLQNALKYSKARNVSMAMTAGPDQLALVIVDDGVGFDVGQAWGRGLGLISMAERVEAIGGALNIRSRPGSGTELDVRVPLGIARADSA
jgi:signal transduction histidine kinase